MAISKSLRWTVHFSGQVQGVGFRYNAIAVARNFDVQGTVENLPDGRVRMIAEGARQVLELFVTEVVDSTHGNVRDIETETSPATGEFNGFEAIR